jgi:hypothetical protein
MTPRACSSRGGADGIPSSPLKVTRVAYARSGEPHIP